MQLTNIDKKILEALLKNKAGLTQKQLCKYSGIEEKNRTIIVRRLQVLYKKGKVEVINSFPKIYYIFINHKEIKLFKTTCPNQKCENTDLVTREQTTKVCTVCKNRYWINPTREKEPFIAYSRSESPS